MSSHKEKPSIFLNLSIPQKIMEQCNWEISIGESLVFIFFTSIGELFSLNLY